jgi:cell division initiation protein
MTAQRATDEAKINAQKEAELIIKDAQLRANKYEDRSRDNVNKLDGEFQSLRVQRDSFLARFRSMLKDQLSLLDVIDEHFEGNKRIAPTEDKFHFDDNDTLEDIDD